MAYSNRETVYRPESHYNKIPRVRTDSSEMIALQEKARSRANYSLALIGMSFVYHGGGCFVDLRHHTPKTNPKRQKEKTIEDRF